MRIMLIQIPIFITLRAASTSGWRVLKNLCLRGEDPRRILASLRAGRMFVVTGDLITFGRDPVEG